MNRKPLPVKIYTVSDAGAGLTPEAAIQRTQELVARANRQALKQRGAPLALPKLPPKKRMNDSAKIKFMFEHGRWPSRSEQAGWY